MQKDIKPLLYNIVFFLRAIMLLTPVMLLFYQYNGLTAVDLFFFQGVFYLTTILSEIPVGYFINKFSGKFLIIISFIIYLLVMVFWLTHKGYYIILIGEILCAISKTIMDNAMSGYLYKFLNKQGKEERMSKQYGYLNFYLAAGTAVAAVLGTYIYAMYSFDKLLITEIGIISLAIVIMLFLPNITPKQIECNSLKKDISLFVKSLSTIFNNKDIIYYIFMSGILTSCSVLFALSFQPLIQNALLPVYVFGIVTLLNHSVRALASFVLGKFFCNFKNLVKLSNLLYLIYIISFILIIITYEYKNKILTLISISLICLFIGLQLAFTILHVSRAHKLIESESRGSLMSVNNFVSRFLTAVILISSKFIFNINLGFEIYYITVLVFFIILSYYLISRIRKLKEV